MDPRFVQGYIDGIEEQRRARRGVGPTNIDGGAPVRPAPRPVAPSPLLMAASGLAPSPMAPGSGGAPVRAAPPVARRPEVNTGAPDHSAASQYAFRSVPGSTRPLNGTNAAPSVGAGIPTYRSPLVAPLNVPGVAPGMMPTGRPLSPEEQFTAEQTAARAEQQSTAIRGGVVEQRRAPEIAALETQVQALQVQADALPYDEQGTIQRRELEAQIVGLRNQQTEISRAIDASYGDIGGAGSRLLGNVLSVAGAPAAYVQNEIVGNLGYRYAESQGDPGVVAQIVGAVANSPVGAVLAADGIGASDYIRWIDDHPGQVAYVQQNGYTDKDGVHHTGGEALFQYYLSSMGIIDSVVTQAITDPTTYVSGGGALGRGIAASADDAGRGVVSRGVRRVVGNTLATPQMLIDAPVDAVVEGVGRGARAVVGALPGNLLDTPLATQASTIVDQLNAAFQNRRAGTRTLREGEQSVVASPRRAGVLDPREDATGGRVPYDASPQTATVIGPNERPEVYQAQRAELVRQRNQAARPSGSVEEMRALDEEIRALDALYVNPQNPNPLPPLSPTMGQPVEPLALPSGPLPPNNVPVGEIVPNRPYDPTVPNQYWDGTRWQQAEARPPALPQGQVRGPDPYVGLMNDYTDALSAGDQAAADAIARRMDDMQAEDAVNADRYLPDESSAPIDAERPVATAPRYQRPEDVPIRESPEYRRGTGPAEVGDDDNFLVVDRTDDGKRWTIYGGDEYPQYQSRAAAITVARREVQRVDAEVASGAIGREAPPVDALTGDDLINVREIDGGFVVAVADDPEPLVRTATREEAEQVAADIRAEAAEPITNTPATGQQSLPDDPRANWRQSGVGPEKMVDRVNLPEFRARYAGREEQVSDWLAWQDERAAQLTQQRGTPSRVTPVMQSAIDRVEEEVAFGEMVGMAPPPQRVSYPDIPAEQITALPDDTSIAQMVERAVFDESDEVAAQARRWFHDRKTTPLTEVADPRLGDAPTYGDLARLTRDLRVRRIDEGLVETVRRVDPPKRWQRGTRTGYLPPEAQMAGDFLDAMNRGSVVRRQARERVQEARARLQSPLPPGTQRDAILSPDEDLLLNARISELGRVGRGDAATGRGRNRVVAPRVGGDDARVVEVYDQAFDVARATMDEDAAHAAAMDAVRQRIEADFGLLNRTPPGRLGRFFDTWADWHSQWSRYGNPIKTTRSITTDFIGDNMQMMLREGPVTAAQMSSQLSEYARKGFKWQDTRLGEQMAEWGFGEDAFKVGSGFVKAEQSKNARSGAARVLTPKIGKVDTNHWLNPGKALSKQADFGRYLNDQLEMGRRSGVKGVLADKQMLTDARRVLPGQVKASRNIAGVLLSDDDIAATIASLGSRFSREDLRLAMERLAVSRGGSARRAANFGERVGRDWASLQNAAITRASERANRALFSYEYTNLDTKLRRVIPFHYWSTRAIPFYLETAARNPALALAYYRMVEGLAERSEEEGWPDSLRFMAQIWSGPMGYVFFIDPVANLGLLGLTDYLFPSSYQDESMSTLGRAIQTATGRSGLGVMPWFSSGLAFAGLMGEDSMALDPTSTYADRNLYGGIIQWAAAHGWLGEDAQRMLDTPVEDLLQRGREVTSGMAEGVIPGAQEIPNTDPNAYPNTQLRNGMIDLLMQERGYHDQSQLTKDDWALINDQFRAHDGPLYDEALVNWSDANLAYMTVGQVFTGRRSMRQAGQLERQTRDDRQPAVAAAPVPGDAPSLANQYETSANLGGRYGRTVGGTSLPEYDPYADNVLTANERTFMQLWQQETGQAYREGDLEAFKERTQYSATMATTTPEAAPYVAAEMGYYNLGPESVQPLLETYNNIRFADPGTGLVIISGREWGPKRLSALSYDERETLANAWLAERDQSGKARETLELRDAWKDAHPEYGQFLDWKREVQDAYEDNGGLDQYRRDLMEVNPNARRYLEDQYRAAREDVGRGASPADIQAEYDKRTLNLGAYLAVNGIQRRLDDPRPESTGDASAVPGPADPRPVGWSLDTDKGGEAQSGDGAGRSGDGGGGRSRETWAAETIAATESGLAQANALMTQQMGYPVDIATLPKGIQDAAMAMLPPGLIPEDSWLYFDYRAWQSHQELQGGPTDLLSYLAATANGREWKAQRTSFSAGGAQLTGVIPAQTYMGEESMPPPQYEAIPGGSYAAYLGGA